MIRVTWLLSEELTVTTFDNPLGLSEGVNLCLTLQHHLMILPKSHAGEDGGETHLFGHVIDIRARSVIHQGVCKHEIYISLKFI
jgi:hypothetical protein